MGEIFTLEMLAAAGDVPLRIAILVSAYAFLGGAIKYIDQAYDEGIGSISLAKILAIASGLIMGARVPITLVTHRQDAANAYLASAVLAKRVAHHYRLVKP